MASDEGRSAHMSQAGALAGPGIMLLSAAIFGYFGFAVTWVTTGYAGQFLFYVAILEWTLKISSVAFLCSAILTFAHAVIGNAVYSVVGLLGAIAFVIVLILDLQDTQHMSVHPLFLIFFAGWNGFGSWAGLREVLATRGRATNETGRFPPALE